MARLQGIFFLWRPLLPDPKDDLVLELAVAAGRQTVATHNVGDFRGAEGLGVVAQRPAAFLESIGVVVPARAGPAGKRSAYDRVLRRVPDAPPEEQDALPTRSERKRRPASR